MSIPRITRLQLESVGAEGEGVVAINFRPLRRSPSKPASTRSGQIPGGGVRPFTIASAPEEEVVALGTDLSSGTGLKRRSADSPPESWFAWLVHCRASRLKTPPRRWSCSHRV